MGRTAWVHFKEPVIDTNYIWEVGSDRQEIELELEKPVYRVQQLLVAIESFPFRWFLSLDTT